MARRILVVDDDPLLCNLLRIALGREGFEPIVLYSGEDALTYLGEQAVDVILLDVMMADINGFEVLRRIKANPALCHIPVILLTARVDAVSRQTGLDLGAVEYLTKPITPERLAARIHAVLPAGT